MCSTNKTGVVIHSNMKVECKAQILNRLFERDLNITRSVRTRLIISIVMVNCAVFLLSCNLSMLAVAQTLMSLIRECIEWSSLSILSAKAHLQLQFINKWISLHSRIACHKLLWINAKKKKKNEIYMTKYGLIHRRSQQKCTYICFIPCLSVNNNRAQFS